MRIDFSLSQVQIVVPQKNVRKIQNWLCGHIVQLIIILLGIISTFFFMYYYKNGLGIAYNDARSHLDIGRRVVEGLKPGLAQIGSVWLPLPHLLMIPTIWNDFMWHSGLAGALQSMFSFVASSLIIYTIQKKIGFNLLACLVGVFVFVANLNILYLQSTAMTELLLLATMLMASYELILWHREDNNNLYLIRSGFWTMLSTLVRYDGWFLLAFSALLILLYTFKKYGYKVTEGKVILYCTLGGFGIFLWLFWNLIIFKDPLYFAFGPFSAHAQQLQLETAGDLPTKHNLFLSLKFYLHAMAYNAGAFTLLLGSIGSALFYLDKKITKAIRFGSLILLAPILFNVVALYLGHSVLFIQGISGKTWFNVRYGIMALPTLAIFIGYLVYRLKKLRYVIIGLLLFVSFFRFSSQDAVTIDDARVGSSQKNVSEVSGWLKENTKNYDGFILISAASHDAIIFSSDLPMKKFIHEGTGAYWESAIETPDHWARWIVMRTYDDNDWTYREIKDAPGLKNYKLIESFPFADIYELTEKFVPQLNTNANLKQR